MEFTLEAYRNGQRHFGESYVSPLVEIAITVTRWEVHHLSRKVYNDFDQSFNSNKRKYVFPALLGEKRNSVAKQPINFPWKQEHSTFVGTIWAGRLDREYGMNENVLVIHTKVSLLAAVLVVATPCATQKCSNCYNYLSFRYSEPLQDWISGQHKTSHCTQQFLGKEDWNGTIQCPYPSEHKQWRE